MHIDTAFVNHLESNVASVNSRIYPDVLPINATVPALIWKRIDTNRLSSHSGSSKLTRVRYQVDIAARTRLETTTAANAIRTSTDNFKGVMGGIGGVSVGRANIENETDDYFEVSQRYWKHIDVIIWHEEL